MRPNTAEFHSNRSQQDSHCHHNQAQLAFAVQFAWLESFPVPFPPVCQVLSQAIHFCWKGQDFQLVVELWRILPSCNFLDSLQVKLILVHEYWLPHWASFEYYAQWVQVDVLSCQMNETPALAPKISPLCGLWVSSTSNCAKIHLRILNFEN